ncbi:hypothetical protein FOL47_011042 [Perkinsus chesapeaki]|uniref:N-acetyltransferase domain-containing protein n=1 Tax=Perkinsus chesapeaki TaxID=330153 RepID=A0A7J6L0Z6_PERCH|nr:hypothetical protein FOL47_011042 [Perkinsus chesapeaki]
MNIHWNTVSFALLILTVSGGIIYRDYQPGDSFTDIIFRQTCPWKTGIPCYVAINTDVSAKTVVGFIVLDIPKKLSKEEQEAVKAKVPGKEGNLGYIRNVEVDSDFSGRGIGTHLIEYGIDRTVVGFIALYIPMTLPKQEEDAVKAKMPGPQKEGDLGYIKNVEVDSSFRGRGIGTFLLQYGIARGKQTPNILAMTLHVGEKKADAIRLYKKLGFVEVMKKGDLELFALYFV